MILTGKTIVGLSAALAAGFVAGLAFIERPAEAATATAKIVNRHPDLSGTSEPRTAGESVDTTVSTTRADRLPDAADCAAQAWPYITTECLVGAPGRSVKPVRTITIEQRVGDNVSVLLRVPGPEARN